MQPFSRPMPLGAAQRVYDVRSPRMAAARAAPWRAHRRLNDDGLSELLRANGQWMMAYTLLQENPEEEAGKVWLTGEAVGAVAGDDVDGEDFHGLGETTRRWS
jgi:hypothetical protein